MNIVCVAGFTEEFRVVLSGLDLPVSALREEVARSLVVPPDRVLLSIPPVQEGSSDGFPDARAVLSTLGFVSGCRLHALVLPPPEPSPSSIRTRVPSGATPLSLDSVWSCPQCTLNNKLSQQQCAVCGFSVSADFLVSEFGTSVLDVVMRSPRGSGRGPAPPPAGSC